MPRAPSEKKAEAEKLFKKGLKLAEIAKKLDVPEGTVRSWKNRGKWSEKPPPKDKCNVANDDEKRIATLQKKKRGGQQGNKIPQDMHHLFQREIKTLKSMGHSPNYILRILMRRIGK